MKRTKIIALLLALIMTLLTFMACGNPGNGDGNGTGNEGGTENEGGDNGGEGGNEGNEGDEEENQYPTITIAEALELCGEPGNITTERYYIRATVKSVLDTTYGKMVIYDETGEIDVYGTYSSDGALTFAEIDDTPVKGDKVLLYCILQNYNGTKEVKNARLIEFEHVEVNVNVDDYTDMSVSDAREASEGALIKTDGTVIAITYSLGKKPAGVLISDGTASIYVYDKDTAAKSAVGDKLTVYGAKTYWILESEAQNASKYGYEGCCQIDSVVLSTVEKGAGNWDKTTVPTSTMKELMETPITENITTNVYKVTALVEKEVGDNFVNYYFYDLDGKTGTYTYTQCNGSDFAWLDEFDGKICTVYLTLLNAKSTPTGCFWRVLPISVSDDNFVFDTKNTAEHVVTYYGVPQFMSVYNADPALELNTKFSSEMLGFTDATITFASSDTKVVSFISNGTVTVMNCINDGMATVTISCTYDGVTYSDTVDIRVELLSSEGALTVADAIKAADDTEVTVKGIIGPSLVNQPGFYLFGEDGSFIAVKVFNTDELKGLKIGHEVIITGSRERYVNDPAATHAGQTCIVNGKIKANYYGKHEYSTAKMVTNQTAEDFYKLDKSVDYSTTLFKLTVTVVFSDQKWTPPKLAFKNADGSDGSITLYCSSPDQYSFLKQFAGQEVTLEIAPCNWNNKSYWVGCVLAVYTTDGKVYNTLYLESEEE